MSRRAQTRKVSRLPLNGTRRPEKIPRSSLWAQSETVDRDPDLYGRRRATRAGGSLAQYGMANEYSDYDVNDFFRGKGTYCKALPGDAVVVNAINREVIGTLLITDAIAYRIAAARLGLTLEVQYSV